MDTVQLYTFLHDMLAGHHCHFDVIPADHLVLIPLNKFPIYIVVNNETSEQGTLDCLLPEIKKSSSTLLLQLWFRNKIL